jgi:uncharacterized protein
MKMPAVTKMPAIMPGRVISKYVLRCVLSVAVLIPFSVAAQYIGQSDSLMKVKPQIITKAVSFNLQDVRLLNSRFKDNQDRNGRWLLGMDIRRLLHSWRVNAGLPSHAKELGGWEALDCELRGHTMGHVLSGLALMYASTGEAAYKKRGDSLVDALEKCQVALNEGGYLSAFPQHLIDRCIAGEPVWAPWYTIHKIMAGLTDMYVYAGNDEALQIVERMSDWAYHKLSGLTPGELALMEKNEFGGMSEVCYNLYAITANNHDQELAGMFYDHSVLDPLAAKEDHLNRLHANTQFPKIIGAARGYELTADRGKEGIADYFWQTVINHHTYATGGNSDDEHFFQPDQLSKHMSARTTETCNTYNMLKLTRHLFTWTADERYADYYEEALYNHILAAQDTATGMTSYFMPFKPGLFKVFSTPLNSFWCCVGTGFESDAKFSEAIYYHDDKGIFVNLFIPSSLVWKEKGVRITQETNYPEKPAIYLTMNEVAAQPMPLYIRYPSWAEAGASIKINGQKVSVKQKPGSYIVLDRRWKKGDRIEINYPMTLRLIATNDDPDKDVVAFGPVVLAGEMGTGGITPPAPYANDQNDFNRYNIPGDVISTLHAKGKDPRTWLEPNPATPLTFKTHGVADREISLIPYYQVQHERYVLYWDLK